MACARASFRFQGNLQRSRLSHLVLFEFRNRSIGWLETIFYYSLLDRKGGAKRRVLQILNVIPGFHHLIFRFLVAVHTEESLREDATSQNLAVGVVRL